MDILVVNLRGGLPLQHFAMQCLLQAISSCAFCYTEKNVIKNPRGTLIFAKVSPSPGKAWKSRGTVRLRFKN